MEWTKKLPIAWLVAAVSLAGNIGLAYTSWQAQVNFAAVEEKLDALTVTVDIYDGETLVHSFESLSTGFQTLGEFLESSADEGLLTIELSGVSEWGRYIISIENTVRDSTYWGMFSETNVACAGLDNFDHTMTDYCGSGIDNIYVVGGDHFTFRLLGY